MNAVHPLLRRQFLERSLLAASGIGIGSAIAPQWLQGASWNVSDRSGRVLVVIQLSGGNDGLNTVIPIQDPEYKKRRPKLAIAQADAITIPQDLALHPSLKGVAGLLEAGRFMLVQGVGYPSPNRSHFESMDIWHSCTTKEKRGRAGWLGRWLDQKHASDPQDNNQDTLAMHLGAEVQPFALTALDVQVPSLSSIEQFRFKVEAGSSVAGTLPKMESPKGTVGTNDLLNFVAGTTESAVTASDRIEKALKQSSSTADFPDSQLGQKLQVIARLIKAGLQTSIYYVTLDGFDTHAQQPAVHAALLNQWSEALSAFVKFLDSSGDLERTLVMTFSEFGRRVAENASDGTDHGAAAPMFFAGAKFDRPIVGKHPSLTDLDDGDLKHHTDFRSVYASVLEQWLKTPAETTLGGSFASLELFR
jgi:uncharacterized protein (DUF1501 family)